MSEYHKINTLFKRDMSKPGKLLMEGEWTCDEFEYLANNEWEFTEKVDGTNIRIIYADGKMTFGGRTDNAQIPADLVAALSDIFSPQADRFAADFPSGVVLYGEGYGGKIQAGQKYRATPGFVLFDVRVGGWWLRRNAVNGIADSFGIAAVPVIGEGCLYEAIDLAKDGLQSTWGEFEAEGIVARPVVEICDRAGHRIITKIKCRDFRSL